MTTVLIIFLANFLNPAEPAVMLHKAYPTEAVCKSEATRMMAGAPRDEGVKISAFCTTVADLSDSE